MSVTAVPLHPIKKGTLAKFWIAIALLVLAAAALAWFGTRSFQSFRTASGVQVRTLREGSGDPVHAQDVFALQYKLHVNSLDAPVIQDSRQSGQPFVSVPQMVYRGFAEGLEHMRAGGRYVMTLPPGTHEQGPMPPGTPFTPRDSLVFEIDLIQVEKGAADRFMQAQQMQQLQQMQQMQQMQAEAANGSAGAEPGAR